MNDMLIINVPMKGEVRGLAKVDIGHDGGGRSKCQNFVYVFYGRPPILIKLINKVKKMATVKRSW